jgi:carboxyl-terminal processing protease
MTHRKTLKPNRSILTSLATISVISAVALIFLFSGTPSEAKDAQGSELFSRTVTAIGRHYYDYKRINPSKMLKASLERVEKNIPEVLVAFGNKYIDVTVGLASRRFKVGDVDNLGELRRAMQNILSFIGTHYTGEESKEDIEYGAISGMLSALDPHSNFLPPKIYNEFKVGTRGKFGGLGIVISIRDGFLTVISPIDGTPASRAGVRTGDRIIQINEESTINMSLMDAVSKLRGKVNTKVSIVIERPGRPSKKMVFTRAIISIESVQSTLVTHGDKQLGYIKIKSFQGNTDADVINALKKFHEGGRKIDGLMLDLRNNPGGLLDVSARIADIFLKKGVIVSTVGPKNRVLEEEVAHQSETEPDYPIMVLINEGSASASEIVAGALQFHNRATIVGHTSFGKGSVQAIFGLGEDSALKLTVAQYKAAGTESIQLKGVTPDIKIIPAILDRDDINLLEDKFRTERDLDEHLEGKTSQKKAKSSSQFQITYLKKKESEEELEKRALREYAKKPLINDDFPTKLTLDLLDKAGQPSRKETLAKIEKPLEIQQAEQQKLITAAMAKLGIDWSVVPIDGKVSLKVKSSMLSGKKVVSIARAGEKVRLKIEVTNTGNAPYSRLIATSEIEDASFLTDREFVFGLLKPGETRSWSVPIEMPKAVPTEKYRLNIIFKDAHGTEIEPTKMMVPVLAAPQPVFAFKYRLSGTPKGVPIKAKTPLNLNTTITNIGKGISSKETTATLSNECGEGIFIKKGRTSLGAIPPGEKRNASFKFHIKNGAASEERCAIDLGLADIKLLTFLQKDLDLDIARGRITPPQGKEYRPPSVTINNVPTTTGEASITITGIINDTDNVKDYYIFLGDRKIAYKPNPESSNEFAFKVSIPLEIGNNRILFAARDVYDLTGRKIFVIERTKKLKK